MKKLEIWDILELKEKDEIYLYLNSKYVKVTIIQTYWDNSGDLYFDYQYGKKYGSILIKEEVDIWQ